MTVSLNKFNIAHLCILAIISSIILTFNSHNIVSGQSGPFVLINVCMYISTAVLLLQCISWIRIIIYT